MHGQVGPFADLIHQHQHHRLGTWELNCPVTATSVRLQGSLELSLPPRVSSAAMAKALSYAVCGRARAGFASPAAFTPQGQNLRPQAVAEAFKDSRGKRDLWPRCRWPAGVEGCQCPVRCGGGLAPQPRVKPDSVPARSLTASTGAGKGAGKEKKRRNWVNKHHL